MTAPKSIGKLNYAEDFGMNPKWFAEIDGEYVDFIPKTKLTDAAPDLENAGIDALEVLEQAFDYLPSGEIHVKARNAINELRAAIAKARGTA